jgi:nitrogen fixation NifU-like protein
MEYGHPWPIIAVKDQLGRDKNRLGYQAGPPLPSSQENALRPQLLKNYSEEVVERILQPANMPSLERPDGYGRAEKEDGDRIELFLRLEGDRIVECTFTAQACVASMACAQAVTELAGGRTFQEALVSVSAERVLELLDGLPPSNAHCARAAVDLFRSALSDALQMRKDSWKKAYRKI